MCRYKVLAWSQKEPIFLLTPYGKEYINELIIRQITGSQKSNMLARVNLKNTLIEKPRGGFLGWFGLGNQNQSKQISVFEAIQVWRKRYNCRLEFKINSNCSIAIASILPSGHILSLHVLQ